MNEVERILEQREWFEDLAIMRDRERTAGPDDRDIRIRLVGDATLVDAAIAIANSWSIVNIDKEVSR